MKKGSHMSEASKLKISIARQGTHLSEASKLKDSIAHRGPRPLSSKALRGRTHSALHCLHMSIANRGKTLSRHTREKIGESSRGKTISDTAKEKIGKASRQRWQNPEYVKRWMKANKISPTKPELELQAILDEHFPDFKYNGDFRLGISLASLIPDFVNINGKKQVIEMFGYYWHTNARVNKWSRTELGKIMAYNSIGYKCLVIWQNELKDKEAVVSKIRKWVE